MLKNLYDERGLHWITFEDRTLLSYFHKYTYNVLLQFMQNDDLRIPYTNFE